MNIYYKNNTGLKGSPKWGALLGSDKRFSDNFFEQDRSEGKFFVVDKHDNVVQRKGKELSLNYFTFLETQIGPPDEKGDPTNYSVVVFRFHSTKEFCENSKEKNIELHGAVHARYFIYDGVDKTEEELIDWAVTTEGLVANDSKTTIYGANDLRQAEELKRMKSSYRVLENSHEELNKGNKELETFYAELQHSYKEERDSHEELKTDHDKLGGHYKSLMAGYEELKKGFEELKKDHEEIKNSWIKKAIVKVKNVFK